MRNLNILIVSFALAACGSGGEGDEASKPTNEPSTNSQATPNGNTEAPTNSSAPQPTTAQPAASTEAPFTFNLTSASGVNVTIPKDGTGYANLNAGDRISLTNSKEMFVSWQSSRVAGACSQLNPTFGYPFEVTYMNGPCVMKIEFFFARSGPYTTFNINVN